MNTTKWIWCNSSPQPDEYGEFVDHFTYHSGNIFLRISSDSNYAAYINGTLAAWGQYADFPYDKVYDEVDVTSFCKPGENRIAILVWYYGIDTTQVYYPGNAGLFYEVFHKENILCRSNARTMSRMSHAYLNHRMHMITGQLGFSYGYDASKEDSWLTQDQPDFTPAIIVEQSLPLRPRPCKKLLFSPEVLGTECIRHSDTDIIFDLSSEQVGFLSFHLQSSCIQNITISYGEHLVSDFVPRKIGTRDFSVFYRTKEGENLFFNPFRRLGCRYLEIHSEFPVKIEKIAIVPTTYPLQEQLRPLMTQQQSRIYDMCVETLRLCMHEHYEDCPWREQTLYTMDSRNQMLCGYYAFGEKEFPRANLQLISKDQREDHLLSICYPVKMNFVIPSFSLHYITECKEYLLYTGDKEFLNEIYPKLSSIIEAFTSRLTIAGLVSPFEGSAYWNFYEWRNGLSNEGMQTFSYDVLLNSLLSISLQNMGIIAEYLGIAHDYSEQATKLNYHIREMFFDKTTGVFYDYPDHASYSQLGNSLAILCGAVSAEESRKLCEKMINNQQMTPISLSMICFKYDAWLKTDRKQYSPLILQDIERLYSPMVDSGGTTVWETETGASDFDGAGSLCHGWSALPIYYYHTLLEKN